jgi:hypothetical protein
MTEVVHRGRVLVLRAERDRGQDQADAVVWHRMGLFDAIVVDQLVVLAQDLDPLDAH